MKHLEETNLDFIPQEIGVHQSELLHLAAAVPNQLEALKIAYCAGAEAMDKFNDALAEEEEECDKDFIEDIVSQILLNRELLFHVMDSCFDNSNFSGSIYTQDGKSLEEKNKIAEEWAYQYYQLIRSALSLVEANLHSIAHVLETHI